MRTLENRTGVFRKVGECLYRYSSNGVYYARIKTDGKEIRRSLRTTDRDLARRNLTRLKDEQRQIDRSQGKLTLRELCDRWLATIQDSKPKTLEAKEYIANKIKEHWPTGSLVQLAKIKPSDCDLWLTRCAQKSRNGFSASSRNAHVHVLKAVFALALRDRIICDSPAAHLKYIKRQRPIRLTPTWEQFKAIIANVRTQVFNAAAQDSADFLEFLGLAGLGQAEACSLACADVDFEAGRIITFRHKTSIGFAVPIFPQLRPLLEKLCEGKSNRLRDCVDWVHHAIGHALFPWRLAREHARRHNRQIDRNKSVGGLRWRHVQDLPRNSRILLARARKGFFDYWLPASVATGLERSNYRSLLFLEQYCDGSHHVGFAGSPYSIRAGEHYFNDTAKPGYTPYTYPHPLTVD